ncbi:MAG: glycoside hydrolase family 88 protein, partial [Prevotella sp.]|nr:glycoside hydrolase family 88 protein [Prevotella sp.]
MKRLTTFLLMATLSIPMMAQTTANEVLSVARKANDYFMNKYADPTVPTNWKKIRPSSLWTRAVYYEGLMALNDVDPQQRYIDYTDQWANFHQWTPRNGINTCDADDQCCAQTYLIRYQQTGDERMMVKARENLDHQMVTPNVKKNTTAKTQSTQPSLYGWWTWIDAIQMAMPIYMQMYKITGEAKYRDHGMAMYRWSRNECGGGLFNQKDGLWW